MSSPFERAAKSLTRRFGLVVTGEELSREFLEFVLDETLNFELQGSKGRVYLSLVLSENEDLEGNASALLRLLEETDSRQYYDCALTYDEERQRVLAWKEIVVDFKASDEALDADIQRGLDALEAYSGKVSSFFASDRGLRGSVGSLRY